MRPATNSGADDVHHRRRCNGCRYSGGAIVALLIQRERRDARATRSARAKNGFVSWRIARPSWSGPPDTMLDYVNSICVEFTGRPLDQLLNDGWLDFVHPEDVDGASAPTCRRSKRGGRSSWSIDCATPTAITDGCWRRGFRSTDRTAVSPAMSAATSTSPNGRTPKIGFARARRHWRRAIRRFSIWPAG